MQSLFCFDFETFGANPMTDRACQFAALRTDMDFNPIDDPINLYCKPADDFIPDPVACLVTGITPQLALEKGLCERDFFREIYMQLATDNTCAFGYNNIRFDDEVVRFGLYRNFYDPYAREWQNGNSRWDLIDLLRMTHALRPEGIHWPKDEDDKVSFRLEKLSAANQIEHENAHDALADVYATIHMAKLVKQQQTKLFDYLFALRDKRKAMAEIDLITHKPFIHCSGMLGSEHQYCGVMMPLVAHPENKNSVICIDLSKTVDDLPKLDKKQIEQRIFTSQQELEVPRLPIKEIHYNKCPAVAPLNVLDKNSQQRLAIDLNQCLKKADNLLANIKSIAEKLTQIYSSHQFPPITNADHALYSGGFFSDVDKQKMQQIRASSWQNLAQSEYYFDDPRLETLLFRYRARNAPDSLTDSEKKQWEEFRRNNFFGEASGAGLTYADFKQKISQLKNDPAKDQQIVSQVDEYVEELTRSVPERNT